MAGFRLLVFILHFGSSCTIFASAQLQNVVKEQPRNCSSGDENVNCSLTTNIELSSINSLNSSQDACVNHTKRPVSERRCLLGLTCEYGYCKDSSCICDKGYTGILCSRKCGKDCGQFGTCINPLGKEEICNCEFGYSGEKCELSQGENPKVPTARQTITTDAVSTRRVEQSPEKDTGTLQHACASNYELRPTNERQCLLGIECTYGYCDISENGGKSCICDKGATGNFCESKCCRDCGDYGYCFLDWKNRSEICNCWANYTGPACEIFQSYDEEETTIKSDSRWYFWVVGSCSIVLILLVVLVIIIPYIMWKHRVILVMKVVHYFQGYEDDDEREWDAFISYKSNPKDEAFVTRVLFPKLEEEFGFKVNVHYRDFIPGDTIANNIIRAVKSSRRTILVITPQYVKGEYTKLEYQVAQQQMLKQKHRIIPILLEDISDCEQALDPNLKFILKSVTYLKWPTDNSDKHISKFWKQLFLSLPKKRNTNGNIIPDSCNLRDSIGNQVPTTLSGKPAGNGVSVTQIQLETEYDHYDKIEQVNRV